MSVERRCVNSGLRVERRAAGQGAEQRVFVTGTVMPYNVKASIRGKYGSFEEVFLPGCFGEDVASRDVIATLHHVEAKTIGRTGGNLELRDSAAGLGAELRMLGTTDCRDAELLLDEKVLRGWSVEFVPKPGGDRVVDGVRELSAVELVGVSLVPDPAYTQALAEVSMRMKNEKARGRSFVAVL